MNLYWCRCAHDRNFGDQLGPLLMARAGAEVAWSEAPASDAVCVGSIAEHLPPGYTGVVAGIGVAHAHTAPDLGAATVLGLRGRLSWEAAGRPSGAVLADPGLLAPRLLAARPEPAREVGVVPHFTDRALWNRWRRNGRGHHLINVTAPALHVIAEIASCRRIVTSSLHAVVVADAFGIASRYEPFPKIQGRGHKFDDHASAVGVEAAPRTWRPAPPPALIAELQDQVEGMLTRAVALTAGPLRRHRRDEDEAVGVAGAALGPPPT